MWPNFFDTLEVEVHQLADFLGDDHDLMELKEKICSQNFKLQDIIQQELMIALINEYSNSMRTQARIKGELIYAEKPKNFKKRIGKYTEINWD